MGFLSGIETGRSASVLSAATDLSPGSKMSLMWPSSSGITSFSPKLSLLVTVDGLYIMIPNPRPAADTAGARLKLPHQSAVWTSHTYERFKSLFKTIKWETELIVSWLIGVQQFCVLLEITSCIVKRINLSLNNTFSSYQGMDPWAPDPTDTCIQPIVSQSQLSITTFYLIFIASDN